MDWRRLPSSQCSGRSHMGQDLRHLGPQAHPPHRGRDLRRRLAHVCLVEQHGNVDRGKGIARRR